MTAKTNAERQRALRDTRRAAGLVRLELWLHPDDHARVRAYADRIAREREKGKTP